MGTWLPSQRHGLAACLRAGLGLGLNACLGVGPISVPGAGPAVSPAFASAGYNLLVWVANMPSLRVST